MIFLVPYIKKRRAAQFFVVGKVSRALGHDICDALIGVQRIYKHVETNKTYEEAFSWLGQTWDVSAEHFQKLHEIASHMYTPSTA